MKKIFLFCTLSIFLASAYAQHTKSIMNYPETKKVDVKDTYFDVEVADPYRWLEDDRSAETKQWVTEENKVTQKYLSQIPFRKKIKDRLTKLWNYEKYSAPFKEGDYTYFYKNNGLQNQSVLYRQKDSSEPEVFLDPNTFSKDATTSLAGLSFTKDGSMAAYQLSTGGSDWTDVVILNVSDKTIIGDTLKDVKFSDISWKGNDGFYYSSYDKPNEGSQLSGITQYHKLFYHKLGSKQSEDMLIFGGEKTPRRYIGAAVTDDERYLEISAANSTAGNELYLQDITKPGSPIIPIVSDFKNRHNIIANVGSKLVIYTNFNAANGRIITVDASNPKPENWKDLIKETDNVLTASTGGGKIFANYLKDATSFVLQYSMVGKLERIIDLPGKGTASGFSGKKNEKDLYYTFTSYIYPTTIFKYTITVGNSSIYKKSGVDFDPSKYESKQVFYTSKDGTRIPMMITFKKGLQMN